MKQKINITRAYFEKQLIKFTDIKFTGQVVFVLIIILVFWSGVNTIQNNYQLQEQINQLKEQNIQLKIQTNDIILQNNFYKSSQYQELSARENLGLGYKGETELLVPDNVALQYVPKSNKAQSNNKNNQHDSNFTQWINFFLDKPNNGIY